MWGENRFIRVYATAASDMYVYISRPADSEGSLQVENVRLFLIAVFGVLANASRSIVRIEFGVCVHCIFILVSTRCGCMELSGLDDESSAVF